MLQDFELVRMFDSLVYENEMNDDLTIGLSARGELDATQSRQALHLA